MDLGLTGKTAIVTGSSRGIGLAIAHALHAEGCNVALNGTDEERVQAAAARVGDRVSMHVADVTDPASCHALVDEVSRRWPAIDILVCNVGSGRSVPPGEETPEEWQRVLNLNLYSATNMVEAARGHLEASGGNVVCISSICGIESIGAPLTYSSAKAALNRFVKGAAKPLGSSGVRINAVAPGNVLSEGGVWDWKLRDDPDGVDRMLRRDTALARLGTPEEIASAVTFLASPRASFTTGSIVVIDGGQTRA